MGSSSGETIAPPNFPTCVTRPSMARRCSRLALSTRSILRPASSSPSRSAARPSSPPGSSPRPPRPPRPSATICAIGYWALATATSRWPSSRTARVTACQVGSRTLCRSPARRASGRSWTTCRSTTSRAQRWTRRRRSWWRSSPLRLNSSMPPPMRPARQWLRRHRPRRPQRRQLPTAQRRPRWLGATCPLALPTRF